MPGASDPELRDLLDAKFGSGSPATWFVAALLALPANDGTGAIEFVGGNYSRVSYTNNVTNWPAAATVSNKTTKANATAITFGNPSADWGPIIAWGLFTVSTVNGGVCRYSNLLDSTITVKSGLTPVQYDPGWLAIEFARPSS